jgi:formate dehydrogenase major subunit
VFHKIADTFCSASGPDKTAAICYAVGWTQHSDGVQIIRSAAILQLLLGSIGRPGAGILALRGHASIQGSTDIPTRPDGTPWSERKKLTWWDAEQKKWVGNDVPDFTATKAPDYRPADDAQGDDLLAGDKPFIMHPEGLGRLYVPTGLKDGPLPTHYEPLESPTGNMLYPRRITNPAANFMEAPDNRYASSPDPRFPYVLSTYRLTEHHTAGGMSRYVSHLAELQPELFCEISTELAAELEIRHGSDVTVVTPRGMIHARAMVTSRITPLQVEGRTVHQVCLPYHWGYKGLVKGDAANDLIALSEEPNVRIMETKALLCSVVSGDLAHGSEAPAFLEQIMNQQNMNQPDTVTQLAEQEQNPV